MLDFRQEVIDEDSFLTINMVAGVAVVEVECAEVRERQRAILSRRLLSLAEEHGGRLAVSLRRVRRMGVSLLRDLMEVDGVCRSRGGRLAVFSVPVHIERGLRETGLLRRLNVHRDALSAVRSVQRRRGGQRAA